MNELLVEARRPPVDGRRECRYCSRRFRPHPGFADHQDQCDLSPLNRPQIIGTAVAMWGGRA